MAKVLKIRKRAAESEPEPAPVRGRAKASPIRTGSTVEKTKSGGIREPGGGSGRYVGKTSGLGVTKFQNLTLEQNKKKRLTDSQLAALWRKEFPNARAEYTEETVNGVRNLYNLGKHGNHDGTPLPDHLRIPQYDESGQPMPFWGERAAAKRESGEGRSVAKASSKRDVVVKKKARR